MWQVLNHEWLSCVREPGDTLLGDLDEAEKGSKVMLLQVRRDGGGVSHHHQQQLPLPSNHSPQHPRPTLSHANPQSSEYFH